LAQDDPGAFLPRYAAALHNKSKRLAELELTEEALNAIEQATGIYRPLARDQPDTFRPAFVEALHTFAEILSMLGRDAQAAEMHREAAADDGH
jgi:tetratricopeptide (TPR) repeat protein